MNSNKQKILFQIIFFLLLLLHRCSADIQIYNAQKVSVLSEQYHNIYNMKISMHQSMPCQGTDTLRLDNMHLDIVNDNLIQSDTIRHVSFRNNSLKNISPKMLSRVRRLTCLDLSMNKFNLYDDNNIQHSFLRVLDLSYQDPEFADQKFKSEIEDLEKNGKPIGITFNTTGMYCPNLEHLILDGNNIASIPDTFSKSFPKLSYVYLNNINALKTNANPDFFNMIPKTVRAVHLENNNLFNVTILNTTEILELYLDGNPLQNIEIVSKKLQVLSLSNGAAMGHIVLRTPYLKYIDLSKNNFYSQSNIRYEDFQFLKTVLLDGNRFSNFSSFDSKLFISNLSLSYNVFEHVTSKDLEHLASLKMLSLKGNKIIHVENDAFKGLKHLEFLDLSENQLIHLPNEWTIPLKNIQVLNVSSNYFTTIRDISISSLSSLSHLFAVDNTFTEVNITDLATLPPSIIVYLK